MLQKASFSQQCLHGRNACSKPFSASRRPPKVRVQAEGGDVRGANIERAFFGENFGARDATPGELASNFGENTLGNFNTEHIVKAPDAMKSILGLSAHSCQASPQLLDETSVERLRQQVPGWRLVPAKEGVASCIRHEWTLKDAAAAEQLVGIVGQVATEQGHTADAKAVGSIVVAELTTSSVGGLTENDFIIAAKINDVDLTELLPKRKPRFWA